ncbi:hypothetical protein IAQ61_006098 [Plenodomus lingam]|uniref:uncharacterized protein n=1 Tax=Leptosphaeria maculans TaxID=5022 RepID=UPI0033188225|nr:hypothetical protein IAQ61_006098 [Plenodomus lingam]
MRLNDRGRLPRQNHVWIPAGMGTGHHECCLSLVGLLGCSAALSIPMLASLLPSSDQKAKADHVLSTNGYAAIWSSVDGKPALNVRNSGDGGCSVTATLSYAYCVYGLQYERDAVDVLIPCLIVLQGHGSPVPEYQDGNFCCHSSVVVRIFITF